MSDESGLEAVYVRPFPPVQDNVWRISQGVGIQPRWSGDGRELLFVEVDRETLTMIVASIDTGAGFRWTLRKLFELPKTQHRGWGDALFDRTNVTL